MEFAGFEFWEGSGLEIINVAEVLDYIGKLISKHNKYLFSHPNEYPNAFDIRIHI